MTKRIISIALLLSFALSAFAQTTGKTFTKSFNTEGQGRIKIDLPGTVDLKVWSNPTIRVEIAVDLPSGNLSMLDQLAQVGRYNLEANIQDESLVITAPNLSKVVRVKGEELREHVAYTIFIPKDLEVVLQHAATVAANVQK
ncbi:MAG: hypothetical protein JNK89_02675 [Saprospiraceae bacterium]|nr:hypothetical protein [Saprospiraceae bacterium]